MRCFTVAPLLALALSAPTLAGAQDHGGHAAHGAAPHAAAAQEKPATTAHADHTLHDGMPHGDPDTSAFVRHDGHGTMIGMLGAYPMARDASGTAWQPDSTPVEGVHGELLGFSTHVHGYATAVYDDQGGRRGDEKGFVASMLMGMAQRPLGAGTFTLKGMVSADPLMGKDGYPLLLATGETADGVTHLVDRQHPHDAFMELSATYSRPLAADTSGFLYLAWPGEPALGPATYMHRASGMANPEAPITHHWLDSTHITFGVATAGVVRGPFKLEGSLFTGREPNQHRWDLDHPRMDSWSARLSYNPGPDWALQVSYGELNSPEQVEPDEDIDRLTASASHNRPLGWGNWATTLAYGRNMERGGENLDALLLESAVMRGPHTVFARGELAQKDELFENEPLSPLHHQTFDVGKLSVGYAYTIPLPGRLALDLGGLASIYALPDRLDPAYGDPVSGMVFARLRLR